MTSSASALYASKTPFRYPEATDYPFDATCKKIVQCLKKLDWEMPGMQIRLRDSASKLYQRVEEIKGKDFRIYFGRIDGQDCYNLNHTSSVANINIPKKELHVYENFSGPAYYTYVGEDWETDRIAFENSIKTNARFYNKERIYLLYEGATNTTCTKKILMGSLNPYLAHYEDNREYSPAEDEPSYFDTKQVLDEFDDWLKENVLKKIETSTAEKKSSS